MPESIITGFFSVLSAAIGGLIGYRSAITATIRKERNEAVIGFQTSFFVTLTKIDPTVGIYINNHTLKGLSLVKILEEDFPRHVMAYQTFRQYLTEKKRIEFDAAWAEYSQYKAEDGKIYVHLGKYFNPAAYPDNLKERDEAIKNIRNILSFAELDHKKSLEP